MRTAELLRDIANVMEIDPDEGYREFDWQIHYSREWHLNEDGWSNLIQRAADTCKYRIRRRPRTIKVSGELPEGIVEQARNLSSVSDVQEYPPGYDIAVALLDLVEQSEEK